MKIKYQIYIYFVGLLLLTVMEVVNYGWKTGLINCFILYLLGGYIIYLYKKNLKKVRN